MTSMTYSPGDVIGGVDTHGGTHHAAVIDALGRHLSDREFEATAAGYRQLLGWMRSYGELAVVGVEGTGSYGAELARVLAAAGISVVEVDRPDRLLRRAHGKSDSVDAYAAAAAVASGRATGVPKARTGTVEAIRVLRLARRSALKARTQTMNQIRAILTTAPAALREPLSPLTPAQLITTLARSRPGTTLSDPATATKTALRHLARRHQTLTTEITDLDAQLTPLATHANPALTAIFGVGPDTAGQLLTTAGDNPHRMRTEAAFAKLTGTAPLQASSGRTNRHRLNRSGDRQANRALHAITLVRMRYHHPTRAYITRRTNQGLSKKDIIRCLKRYLAREIYHALTNNNTTQTTHTPNPTNTT